MSADFHPGWCARGACTAYGAGVDGLHRSAPFVIKTDDPAVNLYIYKSAGPDGADELIEMVKLEVLDGMPWHLAEPILGQEILVRRDSAEAVWRAVAELA